MVLCRRKILGMLFLLCCLLGNVNVQARPVRKKVGLVLGGGGAKGAAEVGVLKVLEEADIPIDYIVGTSIGGIVGGLYSIGYDAADIDSLFRNQNWLFLLSDQAKRESESFLSKDEKERYMIHLPLSRERKVSLPTGYLKGQNILNLFSKLTVGYHHVDDFSTLPIPYRCVAVDLVDGKEVVLSSGSLPMAMRATMSIPGVFAPVEWNGMMLVDGGALNNLPVDVVRDMGADVVICVDLSTGWKKKEDLKSASSVVDQLIGIMGQTKYRKNKVDADIYINPQLKGYTPASFQPEAIDSMVERGKQAARRQWGELMALRDSIYGCGSDTVSKRFMPHEPLHTEAYPIANIRIEGIDGDEKQWVRKKIVLQEHSRVNTDDIDRTLAMLQGLNIFSRVEYRLTNDEPYDLVFMLEPREDSRLNIGARFDTEDLASVIANISNNQQFATNHHYSLTGRISRNPYLEMKYAYGNLFGAKIGISYRMAHYDFDLYADKHKLDALEFLSHSFAGFYTRDIGNFRLKSGVQFDYYHYHSDMFERDGSIQTRSSDHFLNYFASVVMDTYDRRYFPTRGSRIQVQGILHTDDGIHYADGNPFGEAAFQGECAVRLNSRFYLLPKLKSRFLFGSSVPAIYQNYAGGAADGYYLPWQVAWESAQHVHLLERNVVTGQLGFRYRVKGKFYLTALGEYGKEARKFSHILIGDDLWGGALRASYDFVLGPVSIQANYSSLGKNVGFYINAGFIF
uniref:patatin-like phospholipase family protein n=1 Tax=Prevotella sp. TaxID=59823 RepID=UPI0040268EFF